MEKTNNEKELQELKISATEEVKKGLYSNQALISHMNEEFVIDFLFLSPSGGTLNSRIILSPSHFKRMLKAMNENFEKYEKKFGQVEDNLKDKE